MSDYNSDYNIASVQPNFDSAVRHDGYGQPIKDKKVPTSPCSQNHYGQMGGVEDNRIQPTKNPNYGQGQMQMG